MSYLCKYGTKVLENNVEILKCTIVDSYCAFFRFCPNDWCLKMTPASNNCIQKKIYEQEGDFMKQDKDAVEEIVEIEIKPEEKKVSSNKYEVIAVKQTFIVVKGDEGIKTIECYSPTLLVGDIIEL